MKFPLRFWNSLGGLLSTGVALLAVFYPGLTQEAQIAIIAFGNAVIATLITLVSEGAVTPLAAPSLPEGTSLAVTSASTGQQIGVTNVTA